MDWPKRDRLERCNPADPPELGRSKQPTCKSSGHLETSALPNNLSEAASEKPSCDLLECNLDGTPFGLTHWTGSNHECPAPWVIMVGNSNIDLLRTCFLPTTVFFFLLFIFYFFCLFAGGELIFVGRSSACVTVFVPKPELQES